jgi:hypothetical protein
MGSAGVPRVVQSFDGVGGRPALLEVSKHCLADRKP